MKKNFVFILFVFLCGLLFAQNVSTATELTNAITAATSGSVINLTSNIVVSNVVTLNKTLTINGNGYEISVPRPGLDDMGRYNSSPSSFKVFQTSGSSTIVTINDLTIKGGLIGDFGGAVDVNSGTTMIMNRCIVSNSRASLGGGAFRIYGVLYLNGSYVRRNAANYGGGLLIQTGGRAYVEQSSLIENRSTSSNGGGGGVECQSGAIIYFNNSTLANNQSTEIGGAINNFSGTVYFVNSSATGNVAFGTFPGGAIGNNSGSVYIVNSLLAHNYRRTTGSVSNPTGYILDDITAYTGQTGVRMYYSIYHATLPGSMGASVNNVKYNGLNNGSDNTIFSGGILSKITDNDGNEIGEQVFRPFLYDHAGGVAPTLKVGSFVTLAENRGTPTRFANNNNVNPAIAYYNGSSYVSVLGSSASGQEVTKDQVNSSRSGSTPARGAIETETATTLYIVKLNGAAGGTANGGTIYGDVYASGSTVQMTAIPNSGYAFDRWNYVAGGSGTASTSNPYTFTVTQDVTLIPVFKSSAGSYSITYVGNGNTSGTPPSAQTYSSSTTIATKGDLVKTGYTFKNWNTNSNGSGVAYTPGTVYSAGVNLTLYAQWDEDFTLPVELSSFSATVNAENYVQLAWTTQTETNISGFQVYRNTMNQASSAELVSLLITAANNSNGQSYRYIDDEIENQGVYYYWLECIDMDGSSHFFGPVSVTYNNSDPETPATVPYNTALLGAYPNPFQSTTSIRYSSKEATSIMISIFNVKGQLVRSYTQNITQPGDYSLTWDGKNSLGVRQGSGIYFYRMVTPNYCETRKISIIK